MSHADRQAVVPVPVRPALRRFAAEYFAADESERDKGRRRSSRLVRKQVNK